MANRFWVTMAVLLVIPWLIFTTSCARKEIISEPGVTRPPTAEEETEARRLAEEKALEEQRLLEEQLREEARQRRKREELAERERFVNEDIYFEFNKSSLFPEAREILRHKAKWLMAHPGVSVVIEGHCDERGTSEYNMALGDRRTRRAKTYLVDLGILPESLTTISYGEERPLDARHDEEAWAKNRRGHFDIE